jgi:hypothetical protein
LAGAAPEVLSGGKLDKKGAEKALAKSEKAAGKCAKAAIKKTKKLSGKVRLVVVVDEAGKAAVTVKKNTTANDDLAKCLADAVSAVTFPKAEGGAASLTRTYGFTKGKIGKPSMKLAPAFGKLDPKEVAGLFEAQAPEVAACYASRVSAGAGPAGALALRVVVGKDGKVTDSKVEENTTGDAELGTCLAGRVKAWGFAKPEGGAAVVTKGFTFARSDDKVTGTLGDQVMPGVVKAEAVEATFNAHAEEVRACYEAGLKKNGKLAGVCKVKVDLGADGAITGLALLEDSTKDEALVGCVTGKLKTWTFDKPQGGSVSFVRTITFGKK